MPCRALKELPHSPASVGELVPALLCPALEACRSYTPLRCGCAGGMGDTGRLPYGDVEISSPSSRPDINRAVRGRKVELEWAELARKLALVVVLLIAKGSKLDFAADASQRLRLLLLSVCASDMRLSLSVSLLSVPCGMRSLCCKRCYVAETRPLPSLRHLN